MGKYLQKEPTAVFAKAVHPLACREKMPELLVSCSEEQLKFANRYSSAGEWGSIMISLS